MEIDGPLARVLVLTNQHHRDVMAALTKGVRQLLDRLPRGQVHEHDEWADPFNELDRLVGTGYADDLVSLAD